MMSKTQNLSSEEDIISRNTFKRSEEHELTCVLNKFNKNMISSLIESLSDKQQTFVMTKKSLIQEAINLLTEKFSDLDELILYLQLKYIFQQNAKRLWKVLELKNARKLEKPDLTSKDVSYSIVKYCKRNKIFCKVVSERKGHCMWSVFYFDDGSPKTPVYMMTNMKLSLVLLHNIRVKYRSTFVKVIQKVYKASNVEELPEIKTHTEYLERFSIEIYKTLEQSLSKSDENEIQTSKNEQIIQTKTKVVENKKSKEIKTKTILEKEVEKSRTNTVAERKVEKTKVEKEKLEKAKASVTETAKKIVNKNITRERVHADESHVTRISSEVSYDTRKKRTSDQKTFEKREVPPIEKLDYYVKSNSFGTEENVNSVCVVEFQGTNILKGLEKLIENGMADNPLPKYLYKEPRSGKTNFTITL